MRAYKNLAIAALLVSGSVIAQASNPDAATKQVSVALTIQERVPLDSLVAQVNDPSSPRYHKWYTPEEIRAVAGPTDSAWVQLRSQIAKAGLTVLAESATHLLIVVRGSATAVNNFTTQYKNGFFSNGMAFGPESDQPLALDSLKLDDVKPLHHHYIYGRAVKGPTEGVMPSTIKQLYDFNPIYAAGINGVGENIAVATYDGLHLADVRNYYAAVKVSPRPVVDEVYFNGRPAFNPDSAGESQLDGEFAGMIAPGAHIHYFASSQNSEVGEVTMFTAILNDNRSKVVTYSWGMCEAGTDTSHVKAMNKIFTQALAQGINIFVASGDSGASDCAGGNGDMSLAIDYPSAAPQVNSVGGTSIDQNSSTLHERVWNSEGGASGGGISTLFPRPAFQNGLPPEYAKGRAVPDVAFNADPDTGEPAYIPDSSTSTGAPTWVVIGGTSIAAPQWAGFTALVNKARGTKTLGHLTNIIYAFSQSMMSATFNDVVSGNNILQPASPFVVGPNALATASPAPTQGQGFYAGPGWDAATGWGSMKAAALLQTLTQAN